MDERRRSKCITPAQMQKSIYNKTDHEQGLFFTMPQTPNTKSPTANQSKRKRKTALSPILNPPHQIPRRLTLPKHHTLPRIMHIKIHPQHRQLLKFPLTQQTRIQNLNSNILITPKNLKQNVAIINRKFNIPLIARIHRHRNNDRRHGPPKQMPFRYAAYGLNS